MSTKQEVVDATRQYLATADEVKAKRKLLNEELKEAKKHMESKLTELNQKEESDGRDY